MALPACPLTGAAPSPPCSRSTPFILGIAAVCLLLAGVAGAVVLSGDDATPDDQVAQPSTDDEPLPGDDPAASGGPSDPAGSSELTSCVELYSPETLGNRDYAFDGTVTSVDGPNITFAVNELFSGGAELVSADGTVTLDHQGNAGMLFAPEGPALESGTRVLAAGDDGFLWSCGFTQLHSEATATEWRNALAG